MVFDQVRQRRLSDDIVDRLEGMILEGTLTSGQKVELIVEHFRKNVAHLLGGQAKAMVVTDGRLHAVRYKQAFDRYISEKGYTVPTTWDELFALSDQMVADGVKPWCGGIESGGATGWPATDWLEQIMLRMYGGDVYDQWVNHTLLFDSPEVTAAMDTLAGWMKNPEYVNAGFGDYYTFRPSVQYAFIGDGWDLGGRAVMSFNTRNKDTEYRSGNIFNFDWQAMAFVSEDIRVGVQGYFVRQLQVDTSKSTNAEVQKMLVDQRGNKASVNAIGPAVAWLMNGGEMLIEGKFIKEFGAKNRTEGQAFWLTISKPL